MTDTEHGISLRDWIAGQVAAASVTNAEGLGLFSKEERRKLFGQLAEISYEVADAMLRARATTPESPL